MTYLVVKPPFYRVIDLMTTFSLLAKSQRVLGHNAAGHDWLFAGVLTPEMN